MKHLTLQAARERAGITQVELAARSGVDSSRISRYESEQDTNPTYATVRSLERALKLRPGTLVFGEQPCEVSK